MLTSFRSDFVARAWRTLAPGARDRALYPQPQLVDVERSGDIVVSKTARLAAKLVISRTWWKYQDDRHVMGAQFILDPPANRVAVCARHRRV